ncbi:uncharacterized protein Z520_08638 [Fonsecaea multimorphosa CBS 102226]|uniref:Transcription factor domain-containing protein n=1 Tax=Fonsecaea multimorphosa CBS 102226 TaxID=1442371 RepID=A0A0D2KFR2_9EURO|nr:uncharacterized protein Z520_08638 [Fonsecaea multimorphosa CBS 102226]KIX95518.1 hypothetical protein Z520_08638 [Fonsecaea multimorphosa CBS 102226]OAL21364.1 hypothetical protein AYO22_08087 [Fonsecaea multimorphosa]
MKLFFIDSKEQLSRQARELQEAAARSHAAKFSHQYSKRWSKAKSRSPPGTLVEAQHTRTKRIEISDQNSSKDAGSTPLVQHCLDDDDAAAEDADADADAVWSAAEIMLMLLPQSVLIKGQSDPFDVSPVRIDSKAHELILYWRDNYLFPRHHVNAKTWDQSASAVSDWQDARRSLSDQGLGYALLAQVSASIALEADSKQLRESTIIYSHRSTVALRRRLENKEDDLDSLRLLRHVALLQGVETYARNRAAALTHGKMLKRLYDAWFLRGKSFDLKILMLTLYADVHMAITFLVRPHFKPSEKLVMAFYEASGAAAREECNVPISLTHRLNNSITETKLEAIFLMWTQTLAIRSFYGRRLWTFLNQLNVVNHILDAEEMTNHPHDPMNAAFFHIQAYISLAALFFIRLSTLPEHFVAKSHFSAHAALLGRLRHHLQISDSLEAGHVYSQARLWALFAGAQSEYQAALLNKQPRAVASRGWFNVQLAMQLRRCDLLNWVCVKEILQGFMYFKMEPDPSEWYPELLVGMV